MVPMATVTERWRIQINGIVQGVGFRPFIHRLAHSLNLAGWVCNDSHGVLIEIQGAHLRAFTDRLMKEAPPLARLEQINCEKIPILSQSADFQILHTQNGPGHTKVSADSCICKECLRELFDSSSRFYQYPFINCNDCGPRYTLTTGLPYDRMQTSMIDFKLCLLCLNDYKQPENRRYHTETIGCTNCGPQYTTPIANITALIKNGKIAAIKGLGGYQLICDANQSNVIAKLRQRKQRPHKPFALMVLNIASAKQIVEVDDTAEGLLVGSARPIVLLQKKISGLPDIIAPNLADLGIMLPSTPLHYLLFHHLMNGPAEKNWTEQVSSIVLIVTSANMSGEPLIKDNEEADEKLNKLADQVIGHRRNIITHMDDSVVSVVKNQILFIRRARGYVPEPILLPYEIPSILGLGGHLKNTFCVTRGKEAFVSQHIGDIANASSIQCYQNTLIHLLKLLNVKPSYIAHDCHPDFYTTQIAGHFGVPTYSIQHHHAHLASVAAEHHVLKPALGLALDGFGLGENQQNWGGELFLYQGATTQHLASLRPLAQPGGDRVAREPWRMAASALYAMGLCAEIPRRFGAMALCNPLMTLLERQIHCPLTSSCGRLFDAASALLGVCPQNSYEGQAAMQLESLVTQPKILTDGWLIHNGQLNFLPTLRYLLNCDPVTGANIFHGTLAAALTEWVRQQAKIFRINTVLLGGGCFLNRVLVDLLVSQLSAAGLTPLLPKQLPPNDGGISLGQIWVTAENLKGNFNGT